MLDLEIPFDSFLIIYLSLFSNCVEKCKKKKNIYMVNINALILKSTIPSCLVPCIFLLRGQLLGLSPSDAPFFRDSDAVQMLSVGPDATARPQSSSRLAPPNCEPRLWPDHSGRPPSPGHPQGRGWGEGAQMLPWDFLEKERSSV